MDDDVELTSELITVGSDKPEPKPSKASQDD